jgi:hypothetical protein
MNQLDSKSNKPHNQESNTHSPRNIHKLLQRQPIGQHGGIGGKGLWEVPFLLGFVHLLRNNAPSLIKSRGTSSSCFSWSDMAMIEQDCEEKQSGRGVYLDFQG